LADLPEARYRDVGEYVSELQGPVGEAMPGMSAMCAMPEPSETMGPSLSAAAKGKMGFGDMLSVHQASQESQESAQMHLCRPWQTWQGYVPYDATDAEEAAQAGLARERESNAAPAM
jgi:hypothetical protein